MVYCSRPLLYYVEVIAIVKLSKCVEKLHNLSLDKLLLIVSVLPNVQTISQSSFLTKLCNHNVMT